MTYHTSRATIERTIAAVEARAPKAWPSRPTCRSPTRLRTPSGRSLRSSAGSMLWSTWRASTAALRLRTSARATMTQMIAANLAAPYHAAIAASKQMLTQPGVDGIKGKIVNIGDWATERPYKDYLPYLVAKGGLTTMTLALARELAPHMPVAMIQPAMIDAAPNFSEDDKQAVIAQTPLRRFGSAGDVNRLILYLLEGTNFVTGVCYRVDGGRFLGEDG